MSLLVHPDNPTKAALWRLSKSDDGALIVRWLRECLHEQDKANRTTINEQIGRGQGKSLALNELIDTIVSIDIKRLSGG